MLRSDTRIRAVHPCARDGAPERGVRRAVMSNPRLPSHGGAGFA